MGILDGWFIPDRPPTLPGCFVIPSYAVVDRTRPTRPTCAEIDLAIDWWRRFPDAKIIMSTGDNQKLGVTNARVMAEYAEQRGVPRANLIEEDRSLNTWENLEYSMEIITRLHLASPTLVTLDLYTRRAVATACKQGWREFSWLSVYSHGEPAYGYKRFQTYSRWTIGAYEVGAMAFSKLVGWV
jgi:uncharacterized SAM-binding protein YcdF (DUF218 family)